MTLRPALAKIVDALLAASVPGGAITLDAIGEGLGVTAASQDEIDAILHALEAAGRRIDGPQGQNGESTLKLVLDAARALRAETGRAPGPGQIALRIGLPEERVRHALALARVMAR